MYIKFSYCCLVKYWTTLTWNVSVAEINSAAVFGLNCCTYRRVYAVQHYIKEGKWMQYNNEIPSSFVDTHICDIYELKVFVLNYLNTKVERWGCGIA